MNKFHIFDNGRIYIFKDKDYMNAINQRKDILVFCKDYVIGFNAVKDKKKIYSYSYDVKNKTLTAEDFKKFHSIIITDGIKVFMQTGNSATSYFNGKFADNNTRYKEYLQFKNANLTITKEQFKEMKYKVNVEKTLSEITKTPYKNIYGIENIILDILDCKNN